jgi:hypothetical protein
LAQPKIRGWTNYHRHVVSKRVFSRVDHSIFIRLWQWARRRHPNKSSRWLKQKYFEQHGGNIIWRKRFGVRGLFAFSGSSNAGSVPCATPRSPGSRVGAFIIASPVHWVVPRVQKTASCSIQSATTGFIANIFPYRNRVSLKEAFEGLEPDEGKLSRPVLRGLAPSNGGRLLGVKARRGGPP